MRRRSLTVIVILALAAVAVWWWQSPKPPPEKTAAASTLNLSPTLKLVPYVAAPQVAAPVVPPVPASATPASPTTEPNIAADPQKEINTLLTNTIGLIQSGDLVTVFETLVSPDSLARASPTDKAIFERGLLEDAGKPESQIWVQVLQAMQNQTPVYNDAGDRATYQISDPTGQGLTLRPIILQKVGNHWFFSGTDVLRGSIGFGLLSNPPIGI